MNGSQLFEQVNARDCGLHFFYDRNGELTAFARYYEDDEPIQDLYYYVKNAQGDVTDITDDWGNIIASYTYDPWGKITSISGSNLEIANLNPFRYRGYYYDTDTKLYYLQSRYYDPETGRFLNTDAVDFLGATGTQLSYNAFAYCENDPVNYRDIYGSQKGINVNQILYILKKIKPLLPVIIAYIESEQMSADINSSSPPDHPNFKPPKGGNRRVKNPNGKGNGWLSKDGGVWVWTPKMHGGEGWTVQYPNGSHSHAYKGGKMRNHFVTEKPNLKDRIVVAGLLVIALGLLADNITGVGVADDALAVACLAAIPKFKKKVCTVCGEVIYGL